MMGHLLRSITNKLYILRKGFVVWDTSAAQQYLYQKVAAYAICHIAILIIFGLIVQL